jgi:hypothetical protein
MTKKLPKSLSGISIHCAYNTVGILAGLKPNPANPNRHPETQLKLLAKIIREQGWRAPIVVSKRSGLIVKGHGRYEAAKLLGLTQVPVDIQLYASAELETADLIADNKIAELSEMDTSDLQSLLKSLDGIDLELTGFDESSLHALNIFQVDPENTDDSSEFEDDDNPEAEFLAPFPYFGGKSMVAKLVWKRFGDVPNFIEPFFGSGACLLNRPLPFNGNETVNDFDGLICNFWRAVKSDPKSVVQFADWPVNENDLTARHLWLVERKDSLQTKLEGDPDYFDAKIAGWWAWGMACWIGSGFCSGNGPWRVQEVDGVRQLVHLIGAGRGVNRKLVHLIGAGRGVNRKLVHLGGAETKDAKPGRGECGLEAWFVALSERLRRVRVCCGDWKRVCGGNDGDAIAHFFGAGQTCGIFLDPPYSIDANRDMGCYRVDSGDVAHAVREWAIKHGDDERLRIALCGYEGEHKMPGNWKCIRWKVFGGMSALSKDQTRGKENAYRERIWFSPHCVQFE